MALGWRGLGGDGPFGLVWMGEGVRACGWRGGRTGAARVRRGVRRDGAWPSTSEVGGTAGGRRAVLRW